MGLLLSVFNSIFESPTENIFKKDLEDMVLKKMEKSRTVDSDDNSTQRKIAEELGDIKMLWALDEEDRFIRNSEREDKIKEEEKNKAEKKKNEVEVEYENFENDASLTTDNLINQVNQTNVVEDEKFVKFNEYVNTILNDSKTNLTAAEGIKNFTFKLNDAKEQLNIFQLNENTNDKNEENFFSVNTAWDNYYENNPIGTGTNKQDAHAET